MAKFTQVEGRDFGDVRMFALSTCGWCKKTKAFLNRHGVRYSYIDVDLLPEEELEPVRSEQLRFNANGSFPTIVIDGRDCIVGYDEARLTEKFGE